MIVCDIFLPALTPKNVSCFLKPLMVKDLLNIALLSC